MSMIDPFEPTYTFIKKTPEEYGLNTEFGIIEKEGRGKLICIDKVVKVWNCNVGEEVDIFVE